MFSLSLPPLLLVKSISLRYCCCYEVRDLFIEHKIDFHLTCSLPHVDIIEYLNDIQADYNIFSINEYFRVHEE